MTTIGFSIGRTLRISVKAFPFLGPSRYREITFVEGSAEKNSMKSVSQRSTWFPRLMSPDIPIPSSSAHSARMAETEPLCETIPIGPRVRKLLVTFAQEPVRQVFDPERMLGPMILKFRPSILLRRSSSRSARLLPGNRS
jgi:hypothetical protein